MSTLFKPLSFRHGPAMKNKFMLAPLTNTQSHKDGRLSDDEFNWLEMRAKGGFGLTMTCAAHVQANGQGFPGQLGIFSDDHLEGLSRLATAIKDEDSLSIVQLHHAGNRTPAELIDGTPVCPSDDEKTGARALSLSEVEDLKESFIQGALRAEKAGFDGVEIHGAHGYILGQFISPDINQRTDEYGGNLENRSRLLFDVVDGVRERCGPDFIVGVRLSPERFGQRLGEILEVSQKLMDDNKIDFLDMSLWDVFKEPEEVEFKGRSLLSYFADLNRGETKLGVAGKINSGTVASECLAQGVDFVMIGRAAILHHDFPLQVEQNPEFTAVQLPVSADYLRKEGLGENFLKYMSSWDGFVAT